MTDSHMVNSSSCGIYSTTSEHYPEKKNSTVQYKTAMKEEVIIILTCWYVGMLLVCWYVVGMLVCCWYVVGMLVCCWYVVGMLVCCWYVGMLLVCWYVVGMLVCCWYVGMLLVCWYVVGLLVCCWFVGMLLVCWYVVGMLVCCWYVGMLLFCWYGYFTTTRIIVFLSCFYWNLYFGPKCMPKKGKIGPGYGHMLFLLHDMYLGACQMSARTCQNMLVSPIIAFLSCFY